MEIQDFIDKLEAEFEDVEKGTLTAQTSYREIQGWDSMHALIIIALIDTEYDVTLTGEDLVKSETIEDIFSIIQQKTA